MECFPLVLTSKRHVVVLQNTARKYTKARATSRARLSHLVCKISAANPGMKLSGFEMKRKLWSHTFFTLYTKKKKEKKAGVILMSQCLQNCFFWRRSYFFSVNSKSINWSFVQLQALQTMNVRPGNGRLFTVYLSSISVAKVTGITWFFETKLLGE